MSVSQEVEEGRRHIERFRAPAAVRAELTELLQQAGSLVWTRPGLEPAQRSLAGRRIPMVTCRSGRIRSASTWPG